MSQGIPECGDDRFLAGMRLALPGLVKEDGKNNGNSERRDHDCVENAGHRAIWARIGVTVTGWG